MPWRTGEYVPGSEIKDTLSYLEIELDIQIIGSTDADFPGLTADDWADLFDWAWQERKAHRAIAA